ncbi:DNA mismatch repair protein MutS [Erysipelotrichaceae bacterium MTC7]|nr:DNA mismatch repair protein MutS [Erysipelotrichaceae bacterium MTC7]
MENSKKQGKEKKYTPMMMQYLEVKKGLQDCIVFYRLGDFYEMFFDDAMVASKELDLVLTGRNAGVEERVPMCGIPYHAATGYIQRLTQKGYKIAIVEQLEEASAGKIVKRDVVKIVTPGTIMEEANESQSGVYLATIHDFKFGYALCFCEMTCGEVLAKSIDRDFQSLQMTLLSLNVKEIVINETFDKKVKKRLEEYGTLTISYEEDMVLKPAYESLIDVDDVQIKTSFAMLTNYLEHTQKREMSHLAKLEMLEDDSYLQMDFSTKANLELLQPLRVNSKSQTLFGFLNHTKTALGARCLKQWISYPLIDERKINQRLDAIAYLNENFILKDELKEELSSVYDLDRLGAKIAYGNANPQDVRRLTSTLLAAPKILEIFHDCKQMIEEVQVDACVDLTLKLDGILLEDASNNPKDGNIFVDGYDSQLDAYRTIQSEANQYILDLELREKERTGINSLKVGYNRVFGYYIEVSSANLGKLKDDFGYTRKQTLTNAERFVSEELKELEDKILHAKEKSVRREYELYQLLMEDIRLFLPKLHQLARAIAKIDALYALSVVAAKPGYIRPVFENNNRIHLVDNAHPILDDMMKKSRYVTNDLEMQNEDSIMIITGPNMGGKSTFMRQVALTVILAQMGSYVPAKECVLPIFDKIFTRIGASDDIMSGHSTFMVEMMEANYALQNATDHSLILFDEIGRGTSTYDGMSLAYAMLEYLHEHTKAKTLFSTHYHELTSLEETYDGIKNLTVDVDEEDGEIVFLYKMKEGKADKSYGVNVARLAKLPNSLLERASQILANVQQDEVDLHVEMKEVMVKEDHKATELIRKLEQANVEEMTPIEALLFLNELKK